MNSRFLLITVFSFIFSNSLIAQDTLAVFVSAHPDDWQLFMNPNAFNAVKSANKKVVFLHTTAGDSGNGTITNKYLAREEGSLRAIRFMVNSFKDDTKLGTDTEEDTVNINNHQIIRHEYDNVSAYFLRLPDGKLHGEGYERTGFSSLEKLIDGSIDSLVSMDNSTTYISLNDLKNTIKTLIKDEAKDSYYIEIHCPDNDTTINENDHSDHIHSSILVQKALSLSNNISYKLYIDYRSASKPYNLSQNDLLISAATWGVTASGLADMKNVTTFDESHNVWIGRQYYRNFPDYNQERQESFLFPLPLKFGENGSFKTYKPFNTAEIKIYNTEGELVSSRVISSEIIIDTITIRQTDYNIGKNYIHVLLDHSNEIIKETFLVTD